MEVGLEAGSNLEHKQMTRASVLPLFCFTWDKGEGLIGEGIKVQESPEGGSRGEGLT